MCTERQKFPGLCSEIEGPIEIERWDQEGGGEGEGDSGYRDSGYRDREIEGIEYEPWNQLSIN